MVKLVRQNYNTNKKLYNQKKKEIVKKIGKEFLINHVGSTAIPNMWGKNIIDILIGVNNDEQMNRVTENLIDIGYLAGNNSSGSIYRFFANTNDETKSGDIHLHLVLISSNRYNDFLILKKYLLENKNEAKAYSNIKKQIVNLGNNQRNDYKCVKSDYVTKLLERARNFNSEK